MTYPPKPLAPAEAWALDAENPPPNPPGKPPPKLLELALAWAKALEDPNPPYWRPSLPASSILTNLASEDFSVKQKKIVVLINIRFFIQQDYNQKMN